MSDYFKYFPRVNYNITGTVTDNRTAIDITTNFELPEEVRGQVVSYYPFVLSEFDRPEDVSYSYYGSTKYTFLVWKMNNIIDPFFDWYQPAPLFNDYILAKYGTQQTADTLIYRYSDSEGNILAEIDDRVLASQEGTAEERVNASKINTNQVFYVHPGSDTIVAGTAITLQEAIDLELVTQTTATNFEFLLNEEKRTIRVIDNDVIDLVFTEFVKTLRGN